MPAARFLAKIPLAINRSFLFWLSAAYTVALFGAQLAEMATHGRVALHIATANAFYLALLCAYVGAKEVRRWAGGGVDTGKADEGGHSPFRLKGEWFVGLWAVFLLAASFLSQLWPKQFVYPEGLTLIAFEVLGFYIGSSASRWLNLRQEEKAHEALQDSLETGAPPSVKNRRVTKKRERYSQTLLDLARQNGSLRRADAEGRLKISRSAAGRLLAALCEEGRLVRDGDPNQPDAAYRLP